MHTIKNPRLSGGGKTFWCIKYYKEVMRDC